MATTSAERMRAFRARKVKAGMCGVCGQRRPQTKPKLTVCTLCNDAAKIRAAHAYERANS